MVLHRNATDAERRLDPAEVRLRLAVSALGRHGCSDRQLVYQFVHRIS
ncbi:MAG: hypothetical protein QOG10_2476 [Kribbellaceae bacterium]|nr:hypothetical protein [Kribbellaceae bacterium]